MDAKSMRGRHREMPALSIVVVVGQKVQLVLAQEEVKGENTIEAALRLILGLPLEGRVVTLDAGLNQREIAHAIVEKGGLLRGCEKQTRSLRKIGGLLHTISLHGDQRHSSSGLPLRARWTQIGFCTTRPRVSLAR